jgi:hypothetical protein
MKIEDYEIKFQEQMNELKNNLWLKRKVEIHEIEERKN